MLTFSIEGFYRLRLLRTNGSPLADVDVLVRCFRTSIYYAKPNGALLGNKTRTPSPSPRSPCVAVRNAALLVVTVRHRHRPTPANLSAPDLPTDVEPTAVSASNRKKYGISKLDRYYV